MRVSPSAKAAATARIGYSSIIDGARAAGTSTPARREKRARISATSSPPSSRLFSSAISAPISCSVVSRPLRSGLVITPSITISEPSTISAATSGKAAEDGSAGTRTVARDQFRASFQRDLAAMRAIRLADDRRAEMGEHFFGMIARGLGLDDHRAARRIEPAEQHGGFDLRRGDRRLVFDRQRLGRFLAAQAAAPALRLLQHLRALQRQRIENALHRPLAQRGVAVEARDDRMAGDDAHHQPRAGAGIAEIQRLGRLQQRAEPGAPDAPAARPDGARSCAPSWRQACAGAQHVLALEQPFDLRLADREQAEDQRAMRDGFVAGRAHAARQRAGFMGAERRGGSVSMGGVRHSRFRSSAIQSPSASHFWRRCSTAAAGGGAADVLAVGEIGAGDGNRTHDIQLGKLTFYL